MGVRDVGWEDVSSIRMAEDKDLWWAVVNTVIDLQGPLKTGILRLLMVVTSQEGLCYIVSAA
jgi:hypothetical protein